MTPQRIVGIALLVVGVVLMVIGFQATDSVGNQISETFTGHWTDKTNFYIIGGIAAAVLGLVLTVLPGGKRMART